MENIGRVAIVDAGGPIQILGANIESRGSAEHLRFFYRNRGKSRVQRFEITAVRQTPGARAMAQRTIVGASIVPGHSSTAILALPDTGAASGRLKLSVTRARFDDLALWTPQNR